MAGHLFSIEMIWFSCDQSKKERFLHFIEVYNCRRYLLFVLWPNRFCKENFVFTIIFCFCLRLSLGIPKIIFQLITMAVAAIIIDKWCALSIAFLPTAGPWGRNQFVSQLLYMLISESPLKISSFDKNIIRHNICLVNKVRIELELQASARFSNQVSAANCSNAIRKDTITFCH